MKTHHILNGDTLNAQLVDEPIGGERIVTRECLLDGPVSGDTMENFYRTRSDFLYTTYRIAPTRYEEETIPELNKLRAIDEGEVNLWFEDDLFCQVNLWFVCSLLFNKNLNIFLVRPFTSLELGFSGLDAGGLRKAYANRQKLSKVNVNQFALLWRAYKYAHLERLLKLGVQLHKGFPFVLNAIAAYFDTLPQENNPSRLEESLREIITDKNTQDEKVLFKEFQRRWPIYGYGDLQVKRLFRMLEDKTTTD